jgi:archaellum component FlaC
LGEELRNSKAQPFDNFSEPLRSSGIRFGEQAKEVMSGAVPLAKERIKVEITKNKEKLRISEGYRRFGENLQAMFQVMKEYKGRDDLDFIAQEFVTKEKQLQTIEEYIAQLESRIENSQTALRARTQEDSSLQT